MTLFIYFYK